MTDLSVNDAGFALEERTRLNYSVAIMTWMGLIAIFGASAFLVGMTAYKLGLEWGDAVFAVALTIATLAVLVAEVLSLVWLANSKNGFMGRVLALLAFFGAIAFIFFMDGKYWTDMLADKNVEYHKVMKAQKYVSTVKKVRSVNVITAELTALTDWHTKKADLDLENLINTLNIGNPKHVIALQRKLKGRGYYSKAIDGDYGDDTLESVQTFKRYLKSLRADQVKRAGLQAELAQAKRNAVGEKQITDLKKPDAYGEMFMVPLADGIRIDAKGLAAPLILLLLRVAFAFFAFGVSPQVSYTVRVPKQQPQPLQDVTPPLEAHNDDDKIVMLPRKGEDNPGKKSFKKDYSRNDYDVVAGWMGVLPLYHLPPRDGSRNLQVGVTPGQLLDLFRSMRPTADVTKDAFYKALKDYAENSGIVRNRNSGGRFEYRIAIRNKVFNAA